MSIGIILLAAGSSSRLGGSKQLLTIGNESLLVRSVKIAISTTAESVVVVLGSNEEIHKKSIDHLPVIIHYNPDWKKGMGNSIKSGLQQHMKNITGLQAVLIMVCDQPLLSSEHVQKLIDTFNESRYEIVASHYSDTFGVPVLLGKNLFQKLLAIEDSEGAKKIISQFKGPMAKVDFPDGSIDIDTLNDYENFRIRNS